MFVKTKDYEGKSILIAKERIISIAEYIPHENQNMLKDVVTVIKVDSPKEQELFREKLYIKHSGIIYSTETVEKIWKKL